MRSTHLPTGIALASMASALMPCASADAQAQSPAPAGDKVAAEALFEDGRGLMAAGKFAEACPKFADSERLDPSPSTLLNLANCWEKLGRAATAWATYREAESSASAAKRQDYMATAQRHADALAPRLARVVIHVDHPVAGLQVIRDGSVVAPAEWGAAMPIDKGSHPIEATAAGYKPWSSRVEVAQDGAQVTIAVPALEAAPVESPAPAPPQAASAPLAAASSAPEASTADHVDTTQRTIGLLVGGAGVVGLGISGVLALLANGKKNDSLKHCPTSQNLCDPAGVSERNDALAIGDAATVVLALGGAAIVGGAVLWLTAPGGGAAPSRSARIVFAPTLGGAVVVGSW